MSKNNSKTPRKSKLIPRDILDDVPENNLQMQMHNKESVIHGSEPTPGTSQSALPFEVNELLPFTVKIEVEEFDEKQTTQPFAEKRESSTHPIQKFNAPKKTRKSGGVRICKLDPKAVYEEFEKLSKTTTSLADKILEIEIKNTWGKYFYKETQDSIINLLIFNSLKVWQTWCDVSEDRDSPLMYKCYICQKGWWHLKLLIDHIDGYHSDGHIKINLEFCGNECNLIIAHNGGTPRIPTTFAIDSPCWKCGNNSYFHNNSKKVLYYRCIHCKMNFSTCRLLNEHLAICPDYMRHLKGANPEYVEFYKCHICATVKVTKKSLEEHYQYCHMVRSDLPVGLRLKQCSTCNQRFSLIGLHWCPLKKFHSVCTICTRRFPSKLLTDLHTANSIRRYKCRLCGVVLTYKCLEVRHMAERHSDNYLTLPKCAACEDLVVFPQETCRNAHVITRHKRKYDKRLHGWEIVVPKKCVSFHYEESDDDDKVNNSVDIPDTYKTAVDSHSNDQIGDTKASHNGVGQIIVKEIFGNFGEKNENGTEDVNLQPHKKPIESPSIKTEDVIKHKNIKENIGDKYSDESKNSNEEKCELDVKPYLPKLQQSTDPVFYATVLPDRIKCEPLDNYTEESNDNVVIKKEIFTEEDTVKESSSDNRHTSFNIRYERLEYEDILARMFGAKPVNDTLTVKQEPVDEIFAEEIDDDDEEFVDDLIICNSQDNVEEVREEDDSLLEISNDTDSSWSDSEVGKNKKVCKRCKFVGTTLEFKKHLEFCSRPIKCTKCNVKFTAMISYVKHFHVKHHYENNVCPACDNIISNNSTLVNHIKSHVHQSFSKVRSLKKTDIETTVDVLHKCKKCKENVAGDRLFDHWEAHLILAKKPSQIRNSANRSEDESEDENLMMIKSEQMRTEVYSDAVVKDLVDKILRKPETHWKGKTTCYICTKFIDRKHNYRRHLIEHLLTDALHKFEQYNSLKCQVCSAKFWKSDVYKEHMREHACLPIYKCELCSKTFSDSSNFSKHKKIHNLNIKQCVVCMKKFRDVAQLKKHRMLHDLIGPIKCECCSKVFLDTAVYRRHQRMMQYRQNPTFSCRICKSKFASLKKKWDHQWEEHKVRNHQADCPLCFQPFRKYSDVKRHLYKFHGTEKSLKEIRNLYKEAVSSCKERRAAGML